MARKLTIKRVGSLFPALCLMLIAVVVVGVLWLSTAGLPGCVLRYIEQEAAAVGIPIKVQKIRLSPSAGLAVRARGLSLDIPQQDAPPVTLYLHHATVTFSIRNALHGHFLPEQVHLQDGQINLPLPGEEARQLNLTRGQARLRINRQGTDAALTASGCFQGIELQIRAISTIPKGEATEVEGTESPAPMQQLANVLYQQREVFRQIHQYTAGQEWEDEQRPVLKLGYIQRGNTKEPRINIQADIPHYQFNNLDLKDISFNADYHNELLLLHNLKLNTINPETSISLQAGYDLHHRHLTLKANSSAPIFRMLADLLGEEAQQTIQRVHYANPPNIELTTNVSFAENFALNSISLRGKVEQQGARVGQSTVDQTLISFYLKDGDFNIDNIRLEMPEGYISANAHHYEGKGSAALTIELPMEKLCQLITDIGNIPAKLPEDIQTAGKLHMHLATQLSVPEFVPGTTRLRDLVPSLHQAELELAIPELTYQENTLREAKLRLKLDSIKQPAHVDSGAWELGNSSLLLEAEGVDFPAAELQASGMQAECYLKTCGIIPNQGIDSLWLDGFRGQLHIQQLQASPIDAEEVNLTLEQSSRIHLRALRQELPGKTKLSLHAANLLHESGLSMEETQLSLCATDAQNAILQLDTHIGGTPASFRTALHHPTPDILSLNGLQLSLSPTALTPLLKESDIRDILLPKELKLSGQVSLDIPKQSLLNGQFHLQLPELVRTPHQVYVFRGTQIPLAITADIRLNSNAEGSILYDADALINHESGKMNLRIKGDSARSCHITGDNTIPVDVVDALIDNEDAHWIMRDFRFTRGSSRNSITDIDATVEYADGLRIASHCNARLENIEFLMGAIRDKSDSHGNPSGEEYLRTDMGKNPYTRVHEATCGVDVLVQLNCKDAQGAPQADKIDIILTQPYLRYDNRPWFKRMGIKNGVAESIVRGESIVFDLQNNTITLNHIHGKCYPAYSFGMYYPPLQEFMATILLNKPASVQTERCVFPISRNCKVPMSGLIAVQAREGAAFRFLGTDIPLQRFSGFINISDTNVYLDRMNARCWGGVIDAAVCIDFSGKHTSFDGWVQASGMNLEQISNAYGASLTPALCNGELRFRASSPEVNDVEGYGKVSITDGSLMELSLFKPVGQLVTNLPEQLAKLQEKAITIQPEAEPTWFDTLLSKIFSTTGNAVDNIGGQVSNTARNIPFLNHFLRYDIQDAHAHFLITKGHLLSDDMKALGYNLNVAMKMDLNLDDLSLRGNLWPKISSVPTIILSPITFLSDFVIDINVYGTIDDIQWEFGLDPKLPGSKKPNSVTTEPQAAGEGKAPRS